MSNFYKYFILFVISIGYSATFMLPYIKYVFYDQLLLALNCTNEEAGLLLSVYTIMNLILYVPGGFVADKVKAKTVLVYSFMGSGLINYLFAFSMNLQTAWIVWALLSFTTTFAFWPALIKTIRMLGTKDEQGRIFGFFNSGVGIFSAIISSIALYVYALYGADQVGGLKGVVIVQGSVCVLASVLLMFFYKAETDAVTDENDKFQSKDVFVVIKNPMTWIIAFMIFCAHGIYTSTSYFSPYMTNVLGATLTFSGILAIVRTHVIRIVASPSGGIIADKLKSPALFLMILFGFMTAMLVLFMFLPVGTSVPVAIALQLILACFIFAGYALIYSCFEEACIPPKLTGTTVAFACLIGYLPDMIYNPLFGRWLDIYKNDGYFYIFTFLAASGVVGMLMTYLIWQKGKKRNLVEASA